MVEASRYAPGTPIWVDVGVPDLDAAARFYGGLFGWVIPPGDPATGGYSVATLRGKKVAGFGPQMNPGPPMWSTYIKTTDLEATIAAVIDAGGSVQVPAMEVPGEGRMAIFADDAGATFAAWQPTGHEGTELANEPGALTWNELLTRSPEQAKAFYGTVFGWTPVDQDLSDGAYTEWHLEGSPVGGMMPMEGDQWPAEVPNHWMVYFSVADTDESVAKVEALGGAVVVPAFDIPHGRVAIVHDDAGSTFSLIALSA